MIKTDQSVTPEYLAWLDSIGPRHGVGGNEAWNARQPEIDDLRLYALQLEESFGSLGLERDNLRARVAELERIQAQALEALEQAKAITVYTNPEDEAGEFGCCQERTYKGHAKDCYLVAAITAIEQKGN
jgi:hypothetical protein